MSKRRGNQRENAVKRLLEADGWLVTRAAASLGCADLVALKAGELPRLVQVKSEARGGMAGFGPADREALKRAARQAGAEAWLVSWPPRKKAVWVFEDDWPADRRATA